ncbi:MAG: cobalt ECF transporter T component CbiQ [Pseudomonadota bacterium]
MFEEGFIDGDSIIHRLDPRAKTLAAFGFSTVVALSDRFLALIPALILTILLLRLAKLPLKTVLHRLLIVNGLILLLWVFLPFTFEGSSLFTLGPLVVTKEGIVTSCIITLKSNTIVLSLMIFVSTMPIFTMGQAMNHLFVPAKITHLLLFTYRYIHVIYQEYQRLIKAMKIRGFRPRTDLHTYKTYAFLVGMVIIKSYDRAKRVRAAMLCRGFNGTFYDLSEFSFKTSDCIFMGLVLLALTGIGLLQWR